MPNNDRPLTDKMKKPKAPTPTADIVVEAGGVVSHLHTPDLAEATACTCTPGSGACLFACGPAAADAEVATYTGAATLGQPAWFDETTPTAAAPNVAKDRAELLVFNLQQEAAARPQMVGVIGQGSVGRKVVAYLQQQGVAAIALGTTPPSHLSCRQLTLQELQTLAAAIPGAAEELQLQQQKVRVAVAGIHAGRVAGYEAARATARTHPAQLAADAKAARRATRKEEDRQRTLQARALQQAKQERYPAAVAARLREGMLQAEGSFNPDSVGSL